MLLICLLLVRTFYSYGHAGWRKQRFCWSWRVQPRLSHTGLKDNSQSVEIFWFMISHLLFAFSFTTFAYTLRICAVLSSKQTCETVQARFMHWTPIHCHACVCDQNYELFSVLLACFWTFLGVVWYRGNNACAFQHINICQSFPVIHTFICHTLIGRRWTRC